MQFRLRTLLIGTAIVAGVAALWVLFDRTAKTQLGVSHIYQFPGQIANFPAVVGNTIVDRNGTPRIIMLQMITKPPGPNAAVPFHWVDLIAIEPEDKRLICTVDGDPVRIENNLQVFYAIDSDPPKKLTFAEATVDSRASPREKWDILIRPHILE